VMKMAKESAHASTCVVATDNRCSELM
jgi:hypothetical protein